MRHDRESAGSAVLFFVVGFAAGVLKSDLKLPDAVYQLLSTYLLLAIGLKGGHATGDIGGGAVSH